MGNIELKRVIPVLTIIGDKLVKTVQFKKPNYIGDPINAVKIFNDKEVDEVILLDIRASQNGTAPNYQKIEEICSEAFMPFAYGGGIKKMEQVDLLFKLGIEKVVLNSVLNSNLKLVADIASKYGAQSVVASIDIKRSLFGKYHAFTFSGKDKVKAELFHYITAILESGVGELFLNSIDRDGTFLGYDLNLIKKIAPVSNVPMIVSGGAKSLEDFNLAIRSGASAVAAGSFFVYRGAQKGIMINYPSQLDLRTKVY